MDKDVRLGLNISKLVIGILLARATFYHQVLEPIGPQKSLEKKVVHAVSPTEEPQVYELRLKPGAPTGLVNIAGYALIFSGGYGIGNSRKRKKV